VTAGPTAETSEMDNPYVEYNCLQVLEGRDLAVLGSGSHVDPVAEKLGLGYPARDALVTALHAMDFEKDDYDTPRIARVVGPDAATVGTVGRDTLLVRAVDEPTLVSTPAWRCCIQRIGRVETRRRLSSTAGVQTTRSGPRGTHGLVSFSQQSHSPTLPGASKQGPNRAQRMGLARAPY
jgi:hypothetical protein